MQADNTSLGGAQATARVTSHIEWPTVLLIAGFHGALMSLVIWHAQLPAIVAVIAFAILGCFHMSLQHEVLHGHPTPWQRLNEALVFVPATPWLPYARYRDSHRLHHHIELTMPGVDPESYYVTQERWDRAGRLYRAVLVANRTLAGRVLIWPALSIARLLRDNLRQAVRSSVTRWLWLGHLTAAGVTVWLIVGVGDVPWWMYAVGYVYGGFGLTKVRSFAEHLAVAEGTPSAVIRANPLMALLYLNNNLHHTHHALPDAAWYHLPALHRDLGSDDLAAAGAGLYRGYGEVVRRYLFRPFSQPIHPALVRPSTHEPA